MENMQESRLLINNTLFLLSINLIFVIGSEMKRIPQQREQQIATKQQTTLWSVDWRRTLRGFRSKRSRWNGWWWGRARVWKRSQRRDENPGASLGVGEIFLEHHWSASLGVYGSFCVEPFWRVQIAWLKNSDKCFFYSM